MAQIGYELGSGTAWETASVTGIVDGGAVVDSMVSVDYALNFLPDSTFCRNLLNVLSGNTVGAKDVSVTATALPSGYGPVGLAGQVSTLSVAWRHSPSPSGYSGDGPRQFAWITAIILVAIVLAIAVVATVLAWKVMNWFDEWVPSALKGPLITVAIIAAAVLVVGIGVQKIRGNRS